MIPQFAKENFRTILAAAAAGRLALVETTDAKTGEARYVIAAVSDVEGEENAVNLVPFGHLSPNAYEEYDKPEADDADDLTFVTAARDHQPGEGVEREELAPEPQTVN